MNVLAYGLLGLTVRHIVSMMIAGGSLSMRLKTHFDKNSIRIALNDLNQFESVFLTFLDF